MLVRGEAAGSGRITILVDGRYIADGFPGIGRSTFNLVCALAEAERRHRIVVLVRAENADTRYGTARLVQSGCELVKTDIRRWYPAEVARLPGLIRRIQPDVYYSPFFLRPYGIGCPTVVSIFDLIPLDSAYRPSPLTERLVFRIGVMLACRLSSAILVPSQTTADRVRRLLPGVGRKIVVSLLAPDPGFSQRSADEVRSVRRRLGLERPYILHFASPAPHKNTAGLLRAWAEVTAGTEEPDLVGVGEMPSGWSADGNRTRCLTGIDDEDLPALYSGAELFVCPSLVEGFGFPVVEAMACGAPVICGSGGSLAEVAGGAAHLVDVSNPTALATGIRELLGDRARRARLRGLGFELTSRLSWSTTAHTVLTALVDAVRR